ncbi:hypothetical protein AB0I61_31890 [Polymorphospora rubra]|uniref:hypothetical protein n=1 Tax=Polymorphospora rubra TaxID=338584 RepID=UPI0033F4954C
MVVRFDLRAVLDLAEHAVAAPASLYQPDWATVRGEPALTMVVCDVVYLLSSGVPGLERRFGVPRAVYAERGSVPTGGWSLEAHEVIDPGEFGASQPATGVRRPITYLWYLPLYRPVVELLRGATVAGYRHATVDPGDLSIGVVRKRPATAARRRPIAAPPVVQTRGPAGVRPPARAPLAG